MSPHKWPISKFQCFKVGYLSNDQFQHFEEGCLINDQFQTFNILRGRSPPKMIVFKFLTFQEACHLLKD
jgi:hypothetical protein